MTKQLAQTSSNFTTVELTASQATWATARKRANDYLKLHRLPEEDREQLLARIADKLARSGLFGEQELIQVFISTAQEELALLQAKDKDDQRKKTASHSTTHDEADSKSDNRTQTGPRFERSSIRVAPLQAITLLPSSRPRQRLITK